MISTLVGRGAELARIRALLEDDAVRLVTLAGTGGVGKTRLALELARSAAGLFEHGVYFANLSALTSPAGVAEVVARALGFQQGAGAYELRVADFVKDRKVLLALDNFENVLGASAWLKSLAEASPRLKLLITSRAPLGLALEKTVELRPLALPRPDASVEEVRVSDAVRLLLENVPPPGCVVDAANASALAAICERLDGLPLAIELAAHHLRSFTPAALLQRLEATSLPLTGASRARTQRHRTLRETIAWSFNLLGPDEQRAFAALSVFPEDFSAPAAADVCGDPALADASLALHLLERSGERLRLLNTVRDFASEALSERGAQAAAGDRHARFFLRLGQETGARVEAAVRPQDLELLQTELPNFRAALERFEQTAAWMPGLTLAAALGRFFDLRGYWVEGVRWLTAFARPGTPPALRGRALNWAGLITFRLGDFARSGALHRESLGLCQQGADEPGVLDAIDRLQWVEMYQGKLNEGDLLAQQGWELAQRLADPRRLARALGQRGWVEFERGRRGPSEEHYQRAVAMLEGQPDGADLAYMLNALGEVQRSRAEFPLARESYSRALALARELGITRQVATCTYNLAMVAQQTGDREAEVRWLLESLRLTVEIGNLLNLPLDLIGLANLCARRGKAQVGAKVLGAAEALLAPRGGVVGFADKDDHAAVASLLRAHLGGSFETLRAEGMALSADAAIRLAMAALSLGG